MPRKKVMFDDGKLTSALIPYRYWN